MEISCPKEKQIEDTESVLIAILIAVSCRNTLQVTTRVYILDVFMHTHRAHSHSHNHRCTQSRSISSHVYGLAH